MCCLFALTLLGVHFLGKQGGGEGFPLRQVFLKYNCCANSVHFWGCRPALAYALHPPIITLTLMLTRLAPGSKNMADQASRQLVWHAREPGMPESQLKPGFGIRLFSLRKRKIEKEKTCDQRKFVCVYVASPFLSVCLCVWHSTVFVLMRVRRRSQDPCENFWPKTLPKHMTAMWRFSWTWHTNTVGHSIVRKDTILNPWPKWTYT